MEEYREEIGKIQKFLASHPEGASIKEISSNLSLNRNSVAKYLDILQMRGGVDSRKLGTAKIFFAAERAHATSLLRFSSFPVMILDSRHIIEDINLHFSTKFQLKRETIIGKTLDHIHFPFFTSYDQERLLKNALRGSEQRIDLSSGTRKNHDKETLSLIPVVLNDGKPGVAFLIGSDEYSGKDQNTNPGVQKSGIQLFPDESEYIIQTNPDGIITYVNEAYCNAVGKTQSDLIGTSFRPLILYDDAERVTSIIHTLSPENPVVPIEYRAVMIDGSIEWQNWKIRLLLNNHKNPIGYQYTGLNVTEYRNTKSKLEKAEKALEESVQSKLSELREINKQLYLEIASRERVETQLHNTQFAMDNAVDMVLWINQNARIIYSNIAAVNQLGYTRKDLSTLSFGDIFPLYNLSKWDEVWTQLKLDSTIHAETSVITNSDDKIPVDVVFRYLEYKGKEFACCFVRDITSRKQTELALRESETLFRTLAESAPVGIALLTTPAQLEYANPKLIEKLGYSLEEIQDTEFFLSQAFPEGNYLEKIRKLWTRSLESAQMPGSTFDLIVTIRGKDAREREISVRGARLSNQKLLVHCIDITQQVRMEAALISANQKLNTLSSITRHDILNKITVLLGIIGRMKKADGNPELFDSYEKLENSVKFIRSRIEYTKDYKNLGSEAPAWQNVKDLGLRYIKSPILGTCTLNINLPSIEIYADLLLYRAIEKLLEYCVRHSEQITAITMTFSTTRKGGILVIEDNGKGIPDSDKKILFNPENNEAIIGGLQIVREILSVTGLQVTENGIFSSGTRFEIFIPTESLRIIS